MTIAVELLFMFVFAHFLSAFLDDASHNLPSFLFLYRNAGFKFPLTLALSRQGRGNSWDNPLKIPPP